MAVDPSSGDLLVVDSTEAGSGAGRGTVSRFKPNGEPDPFSALGTNAIDGERGPGGKGCGEEASSCDETPQGQLLLAPSDLEVQVAIAPPGADGGTGGDIYVTHSSPTSPGFSAIDVFDPSGAYLGQLSEYFNASHELKPFAASIGVTVDPSGAVYVSDLGSHEEVHKYVPSANPPLNSNNSASLPVHRPASLAAGAGPTAGYLFVNTFNGEVSKLSAATGAKQYTVAEGSNAKVSVNSATGHLDVATGSEVREYDASAETEAALALVSHISTEEVGSPITGPVSGVAVSPTGPSEGDVYIAARLLSDQIGAWGPAKKERPVVEELAVSAVQTEEATVCATIGAEEAPTEFHIDYVDQHSFESEGGFASPNTRHTSERSAGSANSLATFCETLPSLTAHTAYRWQLVATNSCVAAEGSCGTTETTAAFTTFGVYPPQRLPDGRVWEMVSPVEKEGGEVGIPLGAAGGKSEYTPQQASPNGEAITYGSFISFGAAEGSQLTAQYLSRRNPSGGGWSTDNISPNFEPSELIFRDPYAGFSANLEEGAVVSDNPPLAEGAAAQQWNLYWRHNPDGALTTVGTASQQINGSESRYCLAYEGASADFGRIAFAVHNGALLPGNPFSEGAFSLYEWSREPLDAVQALTVKAGSGKYKLVFGAGGPGVSETAELEAKATHEEVEAALDAITNVSSDGGSVTVTGGPGNASGKAPYTIVFDGGPLADAPQPPLEAVDVSLAGGSAEASLATVANGHLTLASVLPSGAAATPQSTISFGAAYGGNYCETREALLRHAISASGSRTFWTYPGEVTSPTLAKEPLYARVVGPDGAETVELDAPQGVAAIAGKGRYLDATPDGRYAFFTDPTKLMPSPANEGDLYRYDVEAHEEGEPEPLADLTANAGEAANVAGMIGVSEDGSYAYFVAKGVLSAVPNSLGDVAKAGEPNLYVWHEGEGVRFIATLLSAEPDKNDWTIELNKQTARVSPDGRHLAFLSTRSLTGYDNTLDGPAPSCQVRSSSKRCYEVFLYDFEDNRLACASCNPSGARPIGTSAVPSWRAPYEQPRYMLDDGRLFFESVDALDLNDTNDHRDVYELEPAGVGDCETTSSTYSPSNDGCLYLISSGKSEDASYFLDASADGRDAFISTREALVPQLDKDGAYDIYDARVGGTPPPPLPAPECESEGDCRGAGTSEGPTFPLGSPNFTGPEEGPNHPSPQCKKGTANKGGKCKKVHKKAKGRKRHTRARAKRRSRR